MGHRSVLVLAALALPACAPTTTYRYSAFVPAVRPIAWDGETPRQAGTLSAEGTLAGTTIEPNLFPQVGDTAVLLPKWTAEGTAVIAVSSRVQLGVRAAYASYDWAQASATGTMPVPGASASWGIGPEIRASFPLDSARRVWLGLAGNIVSYQVPYAEWELQTATPAASICTATTCDGYSLYDTRTEQHMVYSAGIYPSFDFGPAGRYGHAFGVLSGTNGFKNDGFTNQPSNGSTVETAGPIVIVGAGYGFRHEWMHASALLYWPMTNSSSPVDYGPGVQLTVGVDLETIPQEEQRED